MLEAVNAAFDVHILGVIVVTLSYQRLCALLKARVKPAVNTNNIHLDVRNRITLIAFGDSLYNPLK